MSEEEIVAIRKKEAEKGAEIIGASYRNLGVRDGCVSVDLETTRKVVALIRDVDPEIIITHPAVDYMTDHAHTGQLVLWAAPEAAHPNFAAPTKASVTKQRAYLYHTDPQGLIGPDGQIVRVNTVVNISDVIDQKMKAFGAHESQLDFLEKGDSPSVEKTRRWAIARGQQVRVGFGEGFCQQLLEEYPRKNILAKVLGDNAFTL